MKLSVVMPVYNEVNTIAEIVRRVMRVDIPKELIIVDDGSTDGTRDVLRSLAGTPGIRIFFHKKNRGKGAALHTGFKYVTGDLVIIQDADVEYYPDEYRKVIQPILEGKADVVYGSRFLGTHRVYMFTHYLGNRIVNLAANVLYNTMLTDMETGYKAFRAGILKTMDLRAEGFGFEAEFTARVFQKGLRVYETPISYDGRTYDEGKKITWKDGVRTLYWLIACKFSGFDIGRETLARMATVRRYNAWIYEHVSKFVGDRVFEVEAGVGNITRLLLQRPLVFASDLSDDYLSDLRSSLVEGPRLKIVRYDVNDPPPDVLKRQRFDTVLCLNVLEHIEDDSRAIGHLKEIVAPGGRVILLLPAMRGLYSRLDEELGHRRRYDMRDVRRLLKEHGLLLEHAAYLNALGAIGWLVNGRMLRRKLLPKFQLRFFDLFTLLLKVEDWVKPRFGLSLLVVAKRRP